MNKQVAINTIVTRDIDKIADVTGNLTIHGATKPVTTKATIVVAGTSLSTSTEFAIKLSDYGVDVSGAAGKIALEPKITVKADFK